MSSLLELRPQELADKLLARGPSRVMMLGGAGVVGARVSVADYAELAEAFSDGAPEYRDHEAVFLAAGPMSRALFGVFVHQTIRGQAQGGVRNWHYETVDAFLRDGLRLAVGMSRKCALADLWWGGGKGVICAPPSPLEGEARRVVFREFAEFVTSLRGVYVTAEDAGTTPADMEEIHRHTRFATCIPERVGGSGNPSAMTARGVICAMQAALTHMGLGGLTGKQVAMQGAGNVGSFMIERLFEAGVSRIVASEISEARCSALTARFPAHFLEVRKTEPGDNGILAEACDVLCPNALGGVLDAKSIETVRAALVCGAANNPLADERLGARRLLERGITYVPDYVANRMGIVACSNEQAGSLPQDPFVMRHLETESGWSHSIYNVTQEILQRAQEGSLTTTEAAETMANDRAKRPHPIWGHRARDIIEALWREAGSPNPGTTSR